MDLKVLLNRPAEYLSRYEFLLEAISKETEDENPDIGYLREAVQAFKGLQVICQLQTFQNAMGRGSAGKHEWHNLVSDEVRAGIPKQEQKRQS